MFIQEEWPYISATADHQQAIMLYLKEGEM
jgi:hypothetical protein